MHTNTYLVVVVEHCVCVCVRMDSVEVMCYVMVCVVTLEIWRRAFDY